MKLSRHEQENFATDVRGYSYGDRDGGVLQSVSFRAHPWLQIRDLSGSNLKQAVWDARTICDLQPRQEASCRVFSRMFAR
jgi:hypothetical protein